MSSFRPVDSKREEYRKYLEKTGALDVLCKVLVMLYDETEKPTDALDYIRRGLGENGPGDAELEIVKADLEAAKLKIQTLQEENNTLKDRLAKYEPPEETKMEEETSAEIVVAPATSVTEETATTDEAITTSDENVPSQ